LNFILPEHRKAAVLNSLLPLTPFEEYMLCDDSPEHPGCFFLRFKFSGTCNHASLDAALASAVARHPLLTSTVIEGKRGQFKWNPISNHAPAIQWQAQPSTGGLIGSSHLDLSKQSGVAVFGYETSSGVDLLFQFHHSSCDGIGGLQLIEDFFYAYDDAFHKEAGSHQELTQQAIRRRTDPQHLANRGRFGLTRWELFKKVRKQSVSLYGIWHFLTRTPTKLVSIEPTSSHPQQTRLFPTSIGHTFNIAETNQLLAEAHASGTTLNNLLIRDLLLAIVDFRTEKRGGDARQWLRLSIPMNLRRSNVDNLSAANVVSMIFVDRQTKDLSDSRAVLKNIHRQMQQIKELELGLTFPLSLKIAKWLPGGRTRIRRMSCDSRCRCTAVLSNLMRPLSEVTLPRLDGKIVVGDCVMEEFEFLPPVRQGTQASFGAATYADRLNITMHYDSRSMTASDAQELLNHYVQYLQKSVTQAPRIGITQFAVGWHL
jgi:NRPS condensation-like uncharacterized protein